MMNKRKNLFALCKVGLLFTIGVFYSACEYNDLLKTETAVPHSWMLDSSIFNQTKILLTSLRMNDSLLLVANSNAIWNINPKKLNKSIDGNYISGGQEPFDLNPPSLHPVFSSSILNKDELVIYLTKCAACYPHVLFQPSYSSSTTSAKGLLYADSYGGDNSGGYAVINNKYVLVPYEIEWHSAARCALLTIDKVSGYPNDVLSLTSSKEIDLPGSFAFASVGYFSAAYYNKFYVCIYGKTFCVDTLGNYRKLDFYPYQMFTLNNYLFALSINKELYVSSDHGENWNVFTTVDGVLTSFRYFNVGNELYASWGSQIWRFTLIGNSLNYTELNNEGLESNWITSINKCGKYAFVTTLSGLYYKDTTNLNDPYKGK